MHRVITDTDTLKALCDQCSHSAFITIDTEFVREKTYYPKLCLVQISLPDMEEGMAIDVLEESLDLSPLYSLLTLKSVLKIFHASRQDMEIFYHLMGKLPTPVFDTQVAAMVCGHGEAAGYETLVNNLVGKRIDKSQRFTDWTRRPLSDAQIDYAISDVTYLRDVYAALVKEIEEAGRTAWIQEELEGLDEEELYRVDIDEIWRRLRHKSRSPKFLAYVKVLARWRELEAQKQNLPRGWVLKDEVLLEIAAMAPKGVEVLKSIRSVNLSSARLQSLQEAIDTVEAMKPKEYPQLEPRKIMPESTLGAYELLKLLLKVQCDEHKVAQKLVASKEDLQEWLTEKDPIIPALHGWRYEVFGKYAEKMLSGELAFRLDKKTGALKLESLSA